MALNYNHLYYFHVAALEGSVAAAAQRLGVTAATVSEQLRTLERSLGHDLFERTQSGLRLTDPGRITFEHTLPMFRMGDRLQTQLGNGVDRPLPSLRIGLSIAIARTAMVHLIAPLFQLADCVPAIRTSEHVELLRDLKNGGLDLVLCESMPDEVATRNMLVVEVARMPLVAIAAPGFRPAVDWRDARFVHYRPTTPFRGDVETFLANNSLVPKFGGEADDGLLLVEAAAQPGNIAIVPRSLAHDAIEAGRVAVLRDVEPSSSAIHALFPDTAHAKRAVDLLKKSAAR